MRNASMKWQGPVLGALVGALCLLGVTAPSSPAHAAASAYPIPTANAGLGRIVTHPNGNMWFVERDARKLGVIQPNGQVFDFATGGTGQVMDLDIDANGVIWVLINQGRDVMRYDPAAPSASNTHFIHLGDSPGGKRIRISPSGKPWVTWNYDTQHLISIDPVSLQPSTPPNSAACGPNLSMSSGDLWCQAYSPGADIIRIAPGGSGFTRFPQSGAGRDVYSLSPGPVGSVWYARHASGTMTSSPWLGGVGYLNAATGQFTEFDTGQRTAPESLVLSGGTVWFTSVGAAKGIGHLNATGSGALTQVGNYRPTALTVGADGAIWFTDATTNAIVRVPMNELQTTNVDPGQGSVFLDPGPGAVGTTVRGASITQRFGESARLSIAVSPAAASGVVAVRAGSANPSGVLTGGATAVTIPARSLAPGTHTVSLHYSGAPGYLPSNGTARVTVRKATPGVSVRGPSRVKRGKTAAFRVTVRSSLASPSGKVTVRVAGKKKTVKLSHGKATVRIKIARSARPGKKTASTVYSGNGYLEQRGKTTRIRVTR